MPGMPFHRSLRRDGGIEGSITFMVPMLPLAAAA
jgi:hypothetical protein